MLNSFFNKDKNFEKFFGSFDLEKMKCPKCNSQLEFVAPGTDLNIDESIELYFCESCNLHYNYYILFDRLEEFEDY